MLREMRELASKLSLMTTPAIQNAKYFKWDDQQATAYIASKTRRKFSKPVSGNLIIAKSSLLSESTYC